MGHPSGQRYRVCKFCGETYLRTNWMVRRGHELGQYDGKRIEDTHQAACTKRLAAVAETNGANDGK